MKTTSRSSTPFALLGLLAMEPMSGYDIRRAMEDTLSHFWSESYGQIYPTLASLERDGLVRGVAAGKNERGRRVYSLTPSGRRSLAAWRRKAPVSRPFRNELLLKAFTSDGTTVRDMLPHLHALQTEERVRLEEYAGLRRRIRRDSPDAGARAAWLATVRYGELRSRAVLRWCDEALRAFGRVS